VDANQTEQQVAVRCECSDDACRVRILLTRAEIEFIRSVASRVVVSIGHPHLRCDRVLVEEPGRFQVIETFGPAGDIVAHLFPDPSP
jgi:hypothetical protein